MATRTELGEPAGRRRLLPGGVRGALLAALGLVLAGALYLVAVRGEALLIDLSALRALCF